MLKVLFVLSRYPSATETFIQREIDALANKNVVINIFALQTRLPDAMNIPASPHVFYRSSSSIVLSLKVLFLFLLKKNRKLFQGIRYIFSFELSPIYLFKFIRNCFAVLAIIPWMQNSGVSVIHAHFADMATDLALFLNILTGIPFSFSIHAQDFFVSPRNLRGKSQAAIAVFACSRFLADSARKQTHSRNIYAMYHGLFLSLTEWKTAYAYRFQNLNKLYHPKKFELIAIGRFVEKKGFAVLINALKILRDRGIKFQCRIIGGGTERISLQKQIKNAGLTDFVLLLDFLPFQKIIKELEQCHLMIQPSIIASDGDQDNIPNVILEAQAIGVPVLASALPAIQEVVEHEKTGFLVEPGNPDSLATEIKKILSTKSNLKQVIYNANQQIYQKFDVTKNVEILLNYWFEN